ncbi:MAG: hypothetical protein ABIQ86_12100 [Steroidobacteraceae bacterium]
MGRILQPREGNAKSGPVKSTPVNLVQRSNLDLWQALAGKESTSVGARPEEDSQPLSSGATLLHALLQKQGAMFFTDLVRLSSLLAIQVEHALAELVSAGLVTSDNFTGLRALLTPDANKPKSGSHDRRRAIYGIEDAGRWSLLTPVVPNDHEGDNDLSDEQLDRLIAIYLKRWGVITRKVLERETNAPPWRQVLLKLRRVELRGDISGGRFIAGVGGEQFALADTVTALRKQQKLWQEQQDSDTTKEPQRIVLNATDPLNLVGSLLPEKKFLTSVVIASCSRTACLSPCLRRMKSGICAQATASNTGSCSNCYSGTISHRGFGLILASSSTCILPTGELNLDVHGSFFQSI